MKVRSSHDGHRVGGGGGAAGPKASRVRGFVISGGGVEAGSARAGWLWGRETTLVTIAGSAEGGSSSRASGSGMAGAAGVPPAGSASLQERERRAAGRPLPGGLSAARAGRLVMSSRSFVRLVMSSRSFEGCRLSDGREPVGGGRGAPERGWRSSPRSCPRFESRLESRPPR